MLAATGGGPLNVVAQIGKWRAIQSVTAVACQPTPVKITLPGSKSQGNVPAIAVSTGNADTLECTLHRMQIDGAVTVFQGAGGAKGAGSLASPTALWASPGDLSAFDAVLLSCEGAETTGAIPNNLASYAEAGGMVFAEHWHYAWFNAAPFLAQNIATWTTGANFIAGTINAITEANATGMALQQWLQPLLGSSEISMANTEAAKNATLGTTSTLEMATDTSASTPNSPLLFSWSEGSAGGRIVYADFHVGSASGDYGTTAGSTAVPAGATYPTGCEAEGALKPAELVFLYTLFEDLSCGL